MRHKHSVTLLCIAGTLLFLGCSRGSEQLVELHHFPADDVSGVINRSNIEIDTTITCDGNGSFRIEAAEPMVVRLFEIGDLGIDDARLIYRADLRTEDVDGQVYLEMWCRFPGLGEYFSRGLESPLSGTNEWTTQETPFFLQKGQTPEKVNLKLVINGSGTVWIDNIRVLKGPLTL